MNTQPEALQLADWTDWFCRNVNDPKDFRWVHMSKQSAELRRLHALNAQLMEALQALTHSLDYEDLLHDDQRSAFKHALAAIDNATGGSV